MPWDPDVRQDYVQMLFLSSLDKFDLVTFRCVNEGNSSTVGRMWSVRQRITFCRSMLGELVHVVDLKCKVRKIGADDNRAASVEFADLNLLIAARCFQEDELRPAPGGVATNLL